MQHDMNNPLDLDVDSPEKVITVLNNAIDTYFEAASELSGSWQEPDAGKPWEFIAEELSKCTMNIKRRLHKMGYDV